MNDLTTRTTQLPDNIEDLSQFVLVNEERIQALRAQIRAIRKVNLAKEVYEQKLAEAQEIGQITVEAAQKMGELLLTIQKHQGQRTDLTSSDMRTKSEQLNEIGISKQRGNEYEQMALHPEAVKAAVQQAIDNGDVVSRSQVMKQIRELQANKRALEEQNEMLRRQMLVPEIKVIEKEVPPKDYEMYKTEVKRLEKERKAAVDELLEAKRTIRDLKTPTANDNMIKSAKDSMDHFAIATYSYIKEYGGNVWAFDKWADVPEQTRKNFVGAIQALTAFAQQMANNLGGIQ